MTLRVIIKPAEDECRMSAGLSCSIPSFTCMGFSVDIHKITAVESRTVWRMNNDRPVPNEGRVLWIRREKEICVLCFKRLSNANKNHPMFPAQVANLARFRQIGITGRLFATAIRVKVAKGAVTVAIWGHGELVDMVFYREELAM